MIEKDAVPLFDIAKKWLDRYFSGQKPDAAELPLAPQGNAFRQGVWEILCTIPYGEVTTYGSIAKKMAVKLQKERMSSQAVGGAVGHNPISIIIPCHRVIGVNGSLTGYAGGIETKIKLLELEGVDMSSLFIPASSRQMDTLARPFDDCCEGECALNARNGTGQGRAAVSD